MRKLTFIFSLLVLASFVLAACGSTQPANDVMSDDMNNNENSNSSDMNDNMEDNMDDDMNENSDEMADDSHNDMDDNKDDMNDDMMDEDSASDDMSADTPAWFDYEFEDARTGETFTINGFKGKVVMVETMAMWCSNCLKQQGIVKDLHAQLGERDDFVAVGINIDPEEDLAMLQAYVTYNEFDWLYGVASDEVLVEIARTFGQQYLNAPSTPIAIIDKDGGIHTLPFGIKSVDELQNYLDLYLN